MFAFFSIHVDIIVTEIDIQEIDAIGFQEVKQSLTEAIQTFHQSISLASEHGTGSQQENYPGILVYGVRKRTEISNQLFVNIHIFLQFSLLERAKPA